ncbi:hypothetical protein [Alkaliphilus serpentinus]|uniref:Uncharacterized protein n=1 Tax=Alkaliphilus serpentinus TaxID=1482731 RepID=A0A833MDF0_9FIRM|nr:hypothetical protein [Alkaliphilus serpentinus]KAB3528846.1 hypothetical protein F8153_11010 [Alkaliphilus serpentinus]
MITVYLAGISAGYEGEDIEIRYRIFKDQLIKKDTIWDSYKKPAVVGLAALVKLLKVMEEFKEEEITIVVNDPALMEIMAGTSTSKNKDVLKMAAIARTKINELESHITIKDVSSDKIELKKWNEILKF